jgi:uncharacterized membrane protein YbhN (UPF0104 family)
MPAPAKRTWIGLLKGALTLIALFLILRKVDFHAVVPLLRQARPGFLALCLAGQVATALFVAMRWKLLWNTRELQLRKYLFFVFVGYFFNSFLPSSAAAEAIRVVAFGRKYGAVQENIGVNILARGLGLVLQILLAAGSLWWFRQDLARVDFFAKLGVNRGAALLLAGGVAAVVAAGLLFRRKLASQKWLAEMRRVLEDKPLVLKAFGVTILLQASTIFSTWALFMSLYPRVKFWQIVVFPSIVQTILMLPVSFGGVGVRDYLNILLFSDIGGIPADATLAISILGYILIVILALMGGLWMAFRKYDSDR